VGYQRDLVAVVCNDGCYGAEHFTFRRKQRDLSERLIGWPDFAPAAVGLATRASP
jgi:hypothetical protein